MYLQGVYLQGFMGSRRLARVTVQVWIHMILEELRVTRLGRLTCIPKVTFAYKVCYMGRLITRHNNI